MTNKPVAVQVDGKVRAEIVASGDECRRARSHPDVVAHIDSVGRRVQRAIRVPGRIVNFVTEADSETSPGDAI